MLLSIIVPVYNVERYLPRCLDSLMRQGLRPEEYEVICVNDGSPDNSSLILADYVQVFPKVIRVVKQKHQGLSSARNAGMQLAQGEYIAFVDSDDYVVDNAYRFLLDHCCEDKPEVVCFGHRGISTDGVMEEDPEAKPDGQIIFEGNGSAACGKGVNMNVWSKLYRRDFLEQHHIQFVPVMSEDVVFNIEVFWRNPAKVRITNCDVYRHELENVNALMHTHNRPQVLGQLNDLLYDLGVLNQYMQAEQHEIRQFAKQLINTILQSFYSKAYRILLSPKEWKRLMQRRKSLILNEINEEDEPTFVKRHLARLQNMSGRFYTSYLLGRMLYLTIN
ncbi:MAG: glycosyltransferase [Bacteroidaceae bacterium]|nr:glycosyltransferase [Bacteroidaceae bacterium]